MFFGWFGVKASCMYRYFVLHTNQTDECVVKRVASYSTLFILVVVPLQELTAFSQLFSQTVSLPSIPQIASCVWCVSRKNCRFCDCMNNRPFSYSEKESQSNDTLLHFVEFSNVHNSGRSPDATRSNLASSLAKMFESNAQSRLFC